MSKNLFFENLCLSLQSQVGSLAQLVQSICLTSRGSAVRIRQLPLYEGVQLFSCDTFFVFWGVASGVIVSGVLVARPYGDCVWPFVCKHPMPHSSATASLLHPTVRKTRCIALSYVRDCRTAHLWRSGCGDIRCDCSGDMRPPLCGIPASSGMPLTSNPSTPTIRRCPTFQL